MFVIVLFVHPSTGDGKNRRNHGIQKIRMKISIASSGWRFYTATALAMLTSRVMAWFFPYPNRAVEDAPFMLKLLEDVDGLCLRFVHSTSSTPDLDISRWDMDLTFL